MRKTGLAFVMTACVVVTAGRAGSEPSPPEVLNQDELFGEDDYPAEAVRLELEGHTKVRLTINRNGRVDLCQVIQSSGHEVLDQATCRIFQTRAEFEPAHNGRGRPILGKLVRGVTWRLSNSRRLTFQDFRFQTEFQLDADHRLSNCTAKLLLSSGEEQARACESAQFGGSGLFTILRQAGFTGTVDVRGVLAASRTEAGLQQYFVIEAGWTLVAQQNAMVWVNDKGTAQDCVITQAYGPTSANLPLCAFADSLSTKAFADDPGGSEARRINITFGIFARQPER